MEQEDDDLDRLRRSLSAVRTIVIHMGEDLERMQAKKDAAKARQLLDCSKGFEQGEQGIGRLFTDSRLQTAAGAAA